MAAKFIMGYIAKVSGGGERVQVGQGFISQPYRQTDRRGVWWGREGSGRSGVHITTLQTDRQTDRRGVWRGRESSGRSGVHITA